MSRLVTVLLSLVLALNLSACGEPTHEDVARDAIETMSDFGDCLAKITDKSSAQKHVKELEALAAEVKAKGEVMEKMPAPSEEDEKAMQKKLESEMEAAMQKMVRESTRIAQDPEIMAVIGPVLEKM